MQSSSRFVRFQIGLIFVFASVLVTSCGNDEEHLAGDPDSVSSDSAIAAQRRDSIAKAHFLDSAYEAEKHKPSLLNPVDSARVADSLYRTKNHVRDFE